MRYKLGNCKSNSPVLSTLKMEWKNSWLWKTIQFAADQELRNDLKNLSNISLIFLWKLLLVKKVYKTKKFSYVVWSIQLSIEFAKSNEDNKDHNRLKGITLHHPTRTVDIFSFSLYIFNTFHIHSDFVLKSVNSC